MTEGRAGGPRERYRAQVRAEIKQAALDQVANGGAGAVALTGIAKRLGVSGPALYKYFASRDDLLTELILDAYAEVATAVAAAAEASRDASPRDRLHALAAAYRDWALAHPQKYLLLTGPPSPTYQAPPETVDRARAVLGPFLAVLAEDAPAPVPPTCATSWPGGPRPRRPSPPGYAPSLPTATPVMRSPAR